MQFDVIVVAVDLKKLYTEAGHQQQDFVYRLVQNDLFKMIFDSHE